MNKDISQRVVLLSVSEQLASSTFYASVCKPGLSMNLNPSVDELDTLNRIVIAIKAYRYQTGDGQEQTTNESIDAFLKLRLSMHDWKFWHDHQ